MTQTLLNKWESELVNFTTTDFNNLQGDFKTVKSFIESKVGKSLTSREVKHLTNVGIHFCLAL